MIWIRPGSWFLSQTRWFTYRRLYWRGHWTPLVFVTWPGLRVRYFTYRRRDA